MAPQPKLVRSRAAAVPGLAPAAAPAYSAAQIVGGFLAIAAIRALSPNLTPADASQVVVPHQS